VLTLIDAAAKGVRFVHYSDTPYSAALAARAQLPRGSGSQGLFRLEDLAALLDLEPKAFGVIPDMKAVGDPGSTIRRTVAQLMLRGAMLQTDLLVASRQQLEAAGIGRPRLPAGATEIRDGERGQTGDTGAHWEIARQAMTVVYGTRGGEPLARDWAYASCEFLLLQRDYSAGQPHLTWARAFFPNDGRIALYLGAALETLAAPSVQVAIASISGGFNLDRNALLQKAEVNYRAALSLDPSLPDVPLRLGRVLQLTKRPADAIDQLTKAEASLDRTDLKYFAALFLGRSYESLKRDEEARAAFERAEQMFPAAQSPRLALAQMAWRAGDQASAAARIGELPPAGITGDPWWVYDILFADTFGARLDDLRLDVQAFLK